jgi:hypothetical protein
LKGLLFHANFLQCLDLADENVQHTHMLKLLDLCDPENTLSKTNIKFSVIFDFYFYFDVFKYDPQYELNENKYEEFRKTIPDEDSDAL